MDTQRESVALKQVVGAILFAARQPLTTGAIRRILQETAEAYGEQTTAFGAAKEADIKAALQALKADGESGRVGFHLADTAEGFRFQSDPAAGPWVRHMLDVGKPSRLSRPGLETLAIIAYRQPVSRADIEGVRGVAVDHVIKMLMEMQLIKIVGRSELPGRPMLYGTTALFLDHFGIKDLKDLPGIAEMARLDALRPRSGHVPVDEGAVAEANPSPAAEAQTADTAAAAAVPAAPAPPEAEAPEKE